MCNKNQSIDYISLSSYPLETYIPGQYIIFTGPKDMLHYVISSIGVPSLFVAKTGLGAHININWKSLASQDVKNSITFNKPVVYAYAVMIPSVSCL